MTSLKFPFMSCDWLLTWDLFSVILGSKTDGVSGSGWEAPEAASCCAQVYGTRCQSEENLPWIEICSPDVLVDVHAIGLQHGWPDTGHRCAHTADCGEPRGS